MNKKGRMSRLLLTLTTVLMLISGAFQIEAQALKVLSTAWDLACIRMNIQDYERQASHSFKSESYTTYIKELKEYRETEYYNSEDLIVQKFATANDLVQLVVLCAAIYLMVAAPVCIFRYIRDAIRGLRRRRRKTRSQTKNARLD